MCAVYDFIFKGVWHITGIYSQGDNLTPDAHHMDDMAVLILKTNVIYRIAIALFKGFPGGTSGKESACQYRRQTIWV